MAKKDFVPGKDGELLTYGQNFDNYATANTAALGLLPADLTPLTAAQTPFQDAYLALLPAQAAAKAAKEARDDARRDYVAAIRRVARKVQANPNVTNEQRENLGITVPKRAGAGAGHPAAGGGRAAGWCTRSSSSTPARASAANPMTPPALRSI